MRVPPWWEARELGWGLRRPPRHPGPSGRLQSGGHSGPVAEPVGDLLTGMRDQRAGTERAAGIGMRWADSSPLPHSSLGNAAIHAVSCSRCVSCGSRAEPHSPSLLAEGSPGCSTRRAEGTAGYSGGRLPCVPASVPAASQIGMVISSTTARMTG